MAAIKARIENILLLIVDCLRADHLGCYGYPKNTSPCIDTIASRGAIFLQAISNGGGTPEAYPSILASVPPPIDPNEYKTLYKKSLTLPEVLKENGYHTAAFHSNPYLSRFFHYDKGFEVFEDGMKFDSLRIPGVGEALSRRSEKFLKPIIKLLNFFIINKPPIVRAEELTNRAIHWLRNLSGIFLLLHYMDVHRPCMPPYHYLIQFCSRPINRYKIISLYNKIRKDPLMLSRFERETLIALYDASIRYVDDYLRLLLNEFETKLHNTLIIITSDHGDALGERGIYGHPEILYDEIIRVPLIISGPRIKEGTLVRKQVSLMDIAPTIIDLLKLETVKSFHGESLISAIKGKERRAKGTVSVALNPLSKKGAVSYRSEKWKYIRTERIDGEVIRKELYDLRNDPDERTNLSEIKKKKVETFESKVARYTLRVRDRTTLYEKELLSKEDRQRVKERLRALGYMN